MFDEDMVYLAASQKWREDYEIKEADLSVNHTTKYSQNSLPHGKQSISVGCVEKRSKRRKINLFALLVKEQWLRWVIQPWLRQGGTIGGLVILSEDITHQKTTERQGRLLSEIRLIFRPFPRHHACPN